MESELQYYSRRAAEERQAAEHAASPEAQSCHQMLAERYATIVEEHEGRTQTSRT